jgi:hypothetical protein
LGYLFAETGGYLIFWTVHAIEHTASIVSLSSISGLLAKFVFMFLIFAAILFPAYALAS